MKLRIPGFPFPAELLFPGAVFRISSTEKVLCLTFDDGPHPGSTPGLLRILDETGVKAVFFCSGRQAEKYPELLDAIKKHGLSVGNHGYAHRSGWKTGLKEYCADVYKASSLTSDTLFRPPYGRILPCQYRRLSKSFTIVLWDIMPFDYDKKYGAARSSRLLSRNIRPGSVIVLHDTPASSCRSFLSDFIRQSIKRGFRFELIPQNI